MPDTGAPGPVRLGADLVGQTVCRHGPASIADADAASDVNARCALGGNLIAAGLGTLKRAPEKRREIRSGRRVRHQKRQDRVIELTRTHVGQEVAAARKQLDLRPRD
jgi:hypothetical protein